MDARTRLIAAVGILMVLAGIGLYFGVPSMAAPWTGLILALVGAVIVVATLVRASAGRR